jgi:dipeptidase E
VVEGFRNFARSICPHHDLVQSNIALRATDFDQILLRFPGEGGVGIDHWAALLVDGAKYYGVLSLVGKPGSVLTSRRNDISDIADFGVVEGGDARGVHGIWIKDTDESVHVTSKAYPLEGRVGDILSNVALCRKSKGQPGIKLL